MQYIQALLHSAHNLIRDRSCLTNTALLTHKQVYN